MRRFFRWATLGVLAVCPSLGVAQQARMPIVPNYQRSAPRFASLPDPATTAQQVGSGLDDAAAAAVDLGQPVTIPQQGIVDLGAPQPTPAHHYSLQGHALNNHNSISLNGTCDSCGSLGCDGGCAGGACGGGARCGGGWFGGLYYLNLWRDDDKYGRGLAYDDTDLTVPVLTTGMARMEDSSGLGLRLGKMLTPNTAVEFVYWQVFPDDITAVALTSLTPGNLVTPLTFNGLEYDALGGGGPQPVASFFNNAQRLEVRREYDYRNFEVNLLKLPWLYSGNAHHGGGRARLAMLAGFRYFQADESFGFYADSVNEIVGDDPANELLYDVNVENDLYGFQLGGVLDYCISSRLSAQLGSKFGIYGNNMKKKSSVGSVPGGGGGALITTGPYTGQPYGAQGKKEDVAFLGELDAGLAYCVNQNWRLTGGYRVLAVSGIAQAVDQIPTDFSNLADAAYISDQSNLILHGLYFGAEYAW